MASDHQQGILSGNYSEEKDTNQVIQRLTLNTQALSIIWGGSSSKERYWKRTSDDSSEVVQLVGVYWLEVSGRIPLSCLTPCTAYKLFFMIKLKPDASGWVNYPVCFRLRLPGQKSKQVQMKLSECMGKEGWQQVPQAGITFSFPENTNYSTHSAVLTFAMSEIECEDFKTGLFIKEVIVAQEG
ncbi:hypothetical protein HHK36_000685 [Tetracentron sinense]|uniref:Uncharacterized protein n=1 Tax=Tetracentron sinense TaxID=13715 RepID=A0A835A1G2_TETSI|nr:hypothetical protein HHK36_000685 [Tetracentron sinense]